VPGNLGGAHSPRPWPEGSRRSEATGGLPGDRAGTHRQGVGIILIGLDYAVVRFQAKRICSHSLPFSDNLIVWSFYPIR
jgi:hypothetical protein